MLPMAAQLRILDRGTRHEIPRIKGSRFIATVETFENEQHVESVLGPLRQMFPQANHHCWAWRLGRNRDHFRWSDDGEPSGSAGRPILQQIESRHLTNTLVVVTRIFGGTLLGVGGLMRAYGAAAAQALDLCPTREWILRQRLKVSFAYEFDGVIKADLQQAGLAPIEARYDDRVHLVLDVPVDDVETLRATLRDRTAGRARIVSM